MATLLFQTACVICCGGCWGDGCCACCIWCCAWRREEGAGVEAERGADRGVALRRENRLRTMLKSRNSEC